MQQGDRQRPRNQKISKQLLASLKSGLDKKLPNPSDKQKQIPTQQNYVRNQPLHNHQTMSPFPQMGQMTIMPFPPGFKQDDSKRQFWPTPMMFMSPQMQFNTQTQNNINKYQKNNNKYQRKGQFKQIYSKMQNLGFQDPIQRQIRQQYNFLNSKNLTNRHQIYNKKQKTIKEDYIPGKNIFSRVQYQPNQFKTQTNYYKSSPYNLQQHKQIPQSFLQSQKQVSLSYLQSPLQKSYLQSQSPTYNKQYQQKQYQQYQSPFSNYKTGSQFKSQQLLNPFNSQSTNIWNKKLSNYDIYNRQSKINNDKFNYTKRQDISGIRYSKIGQKKYKYSTMMKHYQQQPSSLAFHNQLRRSKMLSRSPVKDFHNYKRNSSYQNIIRTRL